MKSIIQFLAELTDRCHAISNREKDFDLKPWLSLMRVYQWPKNLLLFAPLIAAHKLSDLTALKHATIGALSFCLAASSVYILNDAQDADKDRLHPTKRFRPIASGKIKSAWGVIQLFAATFLCAGILAQHVSDTFFGCLGTYVLLAMIYSLCLRRTVLLDMFALAALYTIRVIAGHAATGVDYSSWLLIFSMFIFLSLAALKRHADLASAEMSGRQYNIADKNMLSLFGVSSGYLAVLVLAIYVTSQQVIALYSHPAVLLLICPLLLYWISRMWLLSHRGKMSDDPVLFALKDVTSYAVAAASFLVLWIAAK